MSNAPRLDHTQEVRFAVVMYGGLSLAIYMNGVAQEMLRLVRATAPDGQRGDFARTDIKGTERVYRKLGQMLRRGQAHKRLSELKEDGSDSILTRFVVDVISGTSAGGINGVFLAKALANEQDMDELKKLWVEEGDFGQLLNDRKFFSKLAPPTQSLFDGQYLYGKLLDALDGMETPDSTDTNKEPAVKSSLVEELDLFVTATDVSGLTLPLRLANEVVYERRHRNVFHFVYTTPYASGDSRNDFSRRHNPFLAFAARSSSSFPVAFAPMRLGDVDDPVRASDFYQAIREKMREKKLVAEDGQFTSADADWRKFYADYVSGRVHKSDKDKEHEHTFPKRAFADGGSLDNKPFSYATDTLLRRRADVPVDRKLIYVEPDPKNPDREPDFDADVDVLKNTLTALAPTVSTETIREDIQRILDRNRLIERLNQVTEEVDEDVAAWRQAKNKELAAPLKGDVWANMGLDEMIALKGIAYGGYYRLKLAALTDELASIVVDAANFEGGSDEFVAIRYFVRAWSEERYAPGRTPAPGRLSQNRFIMDFDLSYRLRRLNFLRCKIDEYSCLDAECLTKKLQGRLEPVALADVAGQLEAFRSALGKAQKALSNVYLSLLQTQRRYHRRAGDGASHPLSGLIHDTGLNSDLLIELLNKPTEEERLKQARDFLHTQQQTMDAFNKIGEQITKDFSETTKKASYDCENILGGLWVCENIAGSLWGVESSEAALAARELLWQYYQGYEDYDMVAFPIMYQTGIGETDIVDVVRVSPYDATSLIDLEAEEKRGDSGRRKLGGVALGHFGAFLDQTWRENDIMWGRLDAAEIIIKTLLPVPEGDEERKAERDSLIKEAQKEILKEEVLPKGDKELRGEYVAALVDLSAGLSVKKTIKKLRAQMARSPDGSPELKKILDTCIGEDGLLDYFKRDYEVNHNLEAQGTVRLFARSSRVIGRMLEVLAEKHRVDSKRITWVTRLGQIFWGLVEVAVPGSFGNLFLRHWIKLLYAFEAFLIVGGLALLDSGMQRFGLLALAVTGATHVTVKVLGDYMSRGRLKFLRALGGVGFVLVAALLITSMVLGFDELLAIFKLRERFAGLPWVQSLAEWRPVAWLVGLPEDWRALALTGVVAGIVAPVVILLKGGKEALVSLWRWLGGPRKKMGAQSKSQAAPRAKSQLKR
jgi:patatin-related protein